MPGAGTPRRRHPFVSLTGTVGGVTTTRRLPVEVDNQGRAIPVGLTPMEGFPDAIVIGESPRRSDQRVASVIWTGWQGGMGTDEYEEMEGIDSFQESDCDTRWQKSLVCRPPRTQIGGSLSNHSDDTAHAFYLGYTDARWLLDRFLVLQTKVYKPSTNSWTNVGSTAGHGIEQITRIDGFTFAVNAAGAIVRTADGVTWSSLATTGIGGSDLPLLAESFDGKLWVLTYNATTLVTTIYSSINALGVAGSVTWTAGGTLSRADNGDSFVRLFVWRYPPNPGYPALWCLTSGQLLYYDNLGGATSWKSFDQRPPSTDADELFTSGHVWRRDGNLYVHWRGTDYITQYTGNTEDVIGPNVRGGLPAGKQMRAFRHIEGNMHHLFVTVYPDSNNVNGAVIAFNDQKGAHSIYRPTGSETIHAMAVGPDRLLVVRGDNDLAYEIPNEDVSDIPAHASGRTYDSAACAHITAWTDGGTPNVPKRALWTRLVTRTGNPLGSSVAIAYQVDYDDSAWVAAGTLSGLHALPYIFAITGGVPFYRIRWKLTLTRGTATTASPVISEFSMAFVRQPEVRFARNIRLDLRDDGPAFRQTRRFGRYSAAALRKWLLLVSGSVSGADQTRPLVALTYGGRGNTTSPTYVSISQNDIRVTPAEHPDSAYGRMDVVLRDLTPPGV